MRRVLRWVKRIVLGTLALVVFLVAVALIVIHTDWGRDKVRGIIESRLDGIFVGGATIGKLEGSPFGKLTLRDLVINGPDKQPAVKVATLELDLAIMPLISHQARVLSILADGVDVVGKRDANGQLELSNMLIPGPKSTWSVALPKIELRHAHVAIDIGANGWVNLDGLRADVAVKLPNGGPTDVRLALAGAWRERAAGFGIETQLHMSADKGQTLVPYLSARVGAVTVAVAGLRMQTSKEGFAPELAGMVSVAASRIAVAQLVPGFELPADVALTASAEPSTAGRPWSHIVVHANAGDEPVLALLEANLDQKHFKGLVATSEIDAAKWTSGNVQVTGAGLVVFDATLPPPNAPPGALPVASAFLHGHAAMTDGPQSGLAVALVSDGSRATTVLGAAGPAFKAQVAAAVTKVGEVVALESATVRASTTDPTTAAAGKLPVPAHGSLIVDLSAHGAVAPAMDLAVAGTVDGKRLRIPGMSAGSLHVAVDAKQLPKHPLGTASVDVRDLVRGTLALNLLTVRAKNRAPDNKIDVAVRTIPKQGPWVVEANALVTPPGDTGTTTIVLENHHVRAGNGGDWRGGEARVVIGPEKITLAGFDSKSAIGSIAADAMYVRAGGAKGDLQAKVDVNHFDVSATGADARGFVDVHANVAKRGLAYDGSVKVTATDVAAGTTISSLAANLDLELHRGTLDLGANATMPGVGGLKLDVSVDTPRDVTNPVAWKKLRKDAIAKGRLQIQDIDIARVASAAHVQETYSGAVAGDVRFDGGVVAGRIEAKNVMAPQTKQLGAVNAQLDFSENKAGDLTPVLSVAIENTIRAQAEATLRAPAQLFDPAAWKALGGKAMGGASLRVERVEITPELLAKLGVQSNMHGSAALTAVVSEGMTSIKVDVDADRLRGGPLAMPVHAGLQAVLDEHGANATVIARSKRSPLFELTAGVPLTLAQLRADPKAAMDAPLKSTLQFPRAWAPDLLGVFGHGEIIAGTIGGKIEVAGTVRAPTAKVQLAGAGLQVPPGPGGKPVKTVDKISIDGTWDGANAKLAIDGSEPEGGTLKVEVAVAPADLANGKATIKATKFDLMPLLAFAPGPAGGAAGRLDADLSVTGFTPKAKLAGELHLANGRVPIAPAVGTLRRAQLDVKIGEHEITVGAKGRLGGGDVTMDGAIAMDGFAPSGGNATIKLRKVAPIGAIEPKIDADISAKLGRKDETWTADLVVEHGKVKIDSTKGEKLDPVGLPDDVYYVQGGKGGKCCNNGPREPDRTSPLLVTNITIKPLEIESDEIRGQAHGKLTISVGNDVAIDGLVEADHGDLDLFGRRYSVERAAVRFDGPPDPLLDIRITHDFPDVTTVTVVRGRPSKPELLLSSDPGTYTQGQLLGFLLGGEPGGDPASGGREQAANAGASLVANKIAGYVKGALPININVLRYESATATNSAAVTIGSWISSKFFVAYRQHLEARPDENTGEGEIEYYLTRRIVLEGTAGDRGIAGLDLLWRKRY